MLASQKLLNTAVSSELPPDPETNPKLFEFVKSHMIHGPCGNVNKECPCMAGEGVLIEIAVKKIPKSESVRTHIPQDSQIAEDIQIVEEGLLSTIKASKLTIHGLFLIIPFSCSNIMLTLTLK